MKGHANLPGLWPAPGEGVLARQGDLVLLARPVGSQFTDLLLDLLADAAAGGGDGSAFIDRIGTACDTDAETSPSDAATRPVPAVVAFGPHADGIAVALYGHAWARVGYPGGSHFLTAGQPYGRLRCILPSPAVSVEAALTAAESESSADPYMQLVGGIVRAAGLRYVPASSPGGAPPVEPPPAVEPAPPAEPPAEALAAEPPAEAGVADGALGSSSVGRDSAGQGFIAVGLTAQDGQEAPRRRPLPREPAPNAAQPARSGAEPPVIVTGVYCKNGHFDDPQARYCAVCGIGMAQLTKSPRPGPRPPLGVLVLDDGSVFRLDSDYVLGREPTLDSSVARGGARPLRLSDAAGLVSRIHARVELHGWQVYIRDLNSANGTHLRRPGEPGSSLLAPGERASLAAGCYVRLGGDAGFRYDSHRHR